MFQIIDKQKSHLPVKSRFLTAAQALKWAKKNLPSGTCSGWGKLVWDDSYYIQRY